MLRPQKREQYALRALFELAKFRGRGPKKISEIAQAQSIPVRFLEVILSLLKGSGLVNSKRGFYGGYYLVRPPEQITVGEILKFLEKPHDPDHCVACVSNSDCPFNTDCAFAPMWNKVREAMYKVYDGTTLQDLIISEEQSNLTFLNNNLER